MIGVVIKDTDVYPYEGIISNVHIKPWLYDVMGSTDADSNDIRMAEAVGFHNR